MNTLVADTSVIINGNLSEQIKSGSIRDSEIIIPQAVFDELQSQASNHKEQGFVGLEQIQKLNKLSEDFGLKIILRKIKNHGSKVRGNKKFGKRGYT